MNAVGLPVVLSVVGRRCVVVGGGAVGARRATTLRDAGARVVVVDPIQCELEGVEIVAAPFAEEMLDGAFLVVVSTNDARVNTEVARAARSRGVLINAAAPCGDGEFGDFSVMSSVERGPIRIGVAGGGPVASLLVRDRIESCLPTGLSVWADELEGLRDSLRAEEPSSPRRSALLREIARDPMVSAAIEAGDSKAIREAIAAAARAAGAVS